MCGGGDGVCNLSSRRELCSGQCRDSWSYCFIQLGAWLCAVQILPALLTGEETGQGSVVLIQVGQFVLLSGQGYVQEPVNQRAGTALFIYFVVCKKTPIKSFYVIRIS